MSQSHASRHVVSEHLQDRLDAGGAGAELSAGSTSSSGQVEISEAYGRRCIPKLVSTLSLVHLNDDDRIRALHVLNTLLANQEAKVEAISAGAAAVLVAPLLGLGSTADSSITSSTAATLQQQLCCNALEALSQLQQGRAAIVATAGLHALTSALTSVPAAAAAALKAFSSSRDGITLVQQSPVTVGAALVDALTRPATSLAACRDIAAVLASVSSTDSGVIDACACQVPAAMVRLARRVLPFKMEGDGAQLVGEVLGEACACLRVICHHSDGKTQVREAQGIEVLSAMLKAPGASLDLKRLAALTLASISVDVAAKVPTMVHAGASLVELLKGTDIEAAGAAAAALRLALEAPDARRKLELMLTAQERSELLGQLPSVPPAYRYVVEIPTKI